MPRRDLFKTRALPDVPFAENLVFYAPLTQGDLTDHVSGISPVTDSHCYVAWDWEEGAYLLKIEADGNNGRYPYRLACLKWTNFGMGLSHGNAVTVCCDVREISIAGNGYSAMISTPELNCKDNPSTAYNCHARYASSSSQSISSWHRYVGVFYSSDNNRQVYWFKDGIYTKQYNWNADLDVEYDSVADCQLHLNNSSYEIYARNALVYNRALTSQEIAML